jgi:hypothetical protein
MLEVPYVILKQRPEKPGGHAIEPLASALIQEIVNAMTK